MLSKNKINLNINPIRIFFTESLNPPPQKIKNKNKEKNMDILFHLKKKFNYLSKAKDTTK